LLEDANSPTLNALRLIFMFRRISLSSEAPMRWPLFLVFGVLACGTLGCGSGGTVLGPSGAPLLLGTDSESGPVIFTKLEAGQAIEILELTYDKFGRVDGYTWKSTLGGSTRTVKVKQTEPPQFGRSAVYAAREVDGATLPARGEATDVLGFGLKDPGGIVLVSSGTMTLDMKTELAYDENGRQQLARQTLTHEGKNYEVVYSDYRRDQGRLLDYKAAVAQIR